ncbi:unnamed protein product [Echinostoma caproni]|uniref:Major sperm protein n=1 Tax=Echinostoma caproni TaxID=27848 RepID=A0A183AQY2_9TREM|nr:unnamed protein product [Echinostoma caproni]
MKILPDLSAISNSVPETRASVGKPCSGNRLLVEFGSCEVGEQQSATFYLVNQGEELPIRFRLPRIAHFRAKPQQGLIKPDTQQMIRVDFVPKQYGTFFVEQRILVLGQQWNEQKCKMTMDHVIYETAVMFHARSHLTTQLPRVKFNPGIVPLVANEVGYSTDLVTFGSNYPCPRTAVVGRTGATTIRGLPFHTHQEWSKWLKKHGTASLSGQNLARGTLIAFPNDRAWSVRPAQKSIDMRTPFCRVSRYTYVDPDYEFTDQETAHHRAHIHPYAQLIRDHAEYTRQFSRDTTLARWEKPPFYGLIPYIAEPEEKPLQLSEIKEAKSRDIYKNQ